MIRTEYFCDKCERKNDDNEEFRYEVILHGDKYNQRQFKICPECIEEVAQFILKK